MAGVLKVKYFCPLRGATLDKNTSFKHLVQVPPSQVKIIYANVKDAALILQGDNFFFFFFEKKLLGKLFH